jgi:hypothetical protein
MKTRLTLKPGQPGTKREVRKYGGRLVAVRFRYDADRRLRFKTVELVEEQKPWVPTLASTRNPDEKVFVRVGFAEADLRMAVKAAGGQRKLWELRIGTAYELGLDNRIVDDDPRRGRSR